MKITFVLHTLGLSGGVKAVFEFANLLKARRHDVTVACSMAPLRIGAKWNHPRKLANEVIARIKENTGPRQVNWMKVDVDVKYVPFISNSFMPDADIVVATWWETAYPVLSLDKSKGAKVFLIQHYETWGGFKEDVDRSYLLGLHNVVNSTWLKNILENDIKAKVDALIPHAPDWGHFYREEVARKDGEIRILMPYRNDKWKGAEDGILAFETAGKGHDNLKLVMFGPESPEKVPGYVEFHNRPSNDELRRLYNSSDIFLFPSKLEGFGMPPMEAMACELAVVTTDVGAVPEYTIPGKTALVSPPGQPALLAANLVRLIEDPVARKEIASAGHEYIQQFTWEKATTELENLFNNLLKGNGKH
jgi:glycosyltransferase involved in cell wall biosynthesis